MRHKILICVFALILCLLLNKENILAATEVECGILSLKFPSNTEPFFCGGVRSDLNKNRRLKMTVGVIFGQAIEGGIRSKSFDTLISYKIRGKTSLSSNIGLSLGLHYYWENYENYDETDNVVWQASTLTPEVSLFFQKLKQGKLEEGKFVSGKYWQIAVKAGYGNVSQIKSEISNVTETDKSLNWAAELGFGKIGKTKGMFFIKGQGNSYKNNKNFGSTYYSIGYRFYWRGE